MQVSVHPTSTQPSIHPSIHHLWAIHTTCLEQAAEGSGSGQQSWSMTYIDWASLLKADRGQGKWHDRLRIVQSQHWGIRALNTNTFTAGWINESHLESSLSCSRPFCCHLWSFLDDSLLVGPTVKITHWENTGKSGDPFYCLSASMTEGLTSIKLGDNLWLLFSCVSLH